MFRPSPCPIHYDGHLATMPSADFCLITLWVTPYRAIGFHRVRSYGSMTPACLDFCSTSSPVWWFTDRLLSRSPRIRTLTFPAQLHHLRWPLNHPASSSCANSPSAYASYDVFVHQLAVLRPASFRPFLTDQPLPFASSYHLITRRFIDGDLPTEDFHLIS